MNLFIFSCDDVEMAAASVDPKKPKHHVFKLKTIHEGRSENDEKFFLIPEGVNNDENNVNNINRQYERYERYMGHLKTSMKQLNERLEGKIFRNEEITEAEPGIYTWIIKNDTLYAIRIFIQQEIGTLHLDLDRHTHEEEGDITSAGELKVNSHENPKIVFNLQSGTYTAKINGFHLKPDIAHLFMHRESTLFDEVQKDAWDMIDAMNKYALSIKNMKDRSSFVKKHIIQQSKGTLLTDVQIKGLLGKRVISDKIGPFQERIKNRIILEKRNHMVETVREKICSFFPNPNHDCKHNGIDIVQFLWSGQKKDSEFIESDKKGHEFEVTAGKSLLVRDPNSSFEYTPIISTQANLNLLKGFKKGKIRKYMSLKSRYQAPTHIRPNGNNGNNNNTRKAKNSKRK